MRASRSDWFWVRREVVSAMSPRQSVVASCLAAMEVVDLLIL